MLQTEQILQGRYQLQQLLGNNAGRQTWLATDTGMSPASLVILKLLAFSPEMQWEEFKLFEREANILKQLSHPRIPCYRDYFSLDKQAGAGLCWFGLVQDYIAGSSVQQLLDEGRHFTEGEVRSVATQVLEILRYLHGLNPPVIHRDIKPSNLIIAENEQVYLVDFGAVQDTAAAAGATFTVVGTTGYAPLEQFWGKAVPASDLYALGATLIHLLTGTPPANLPQRDLRIEFQGQVSINPNFVSWIEALTEPDLELRLSGAGVALEALETGSLLSSTLQEIKPPFRTRIRIEKSATQMKIQIPGGGLWSLGAWLLKLTMLGFLGVSILVIVICPLYLILLVAIAGLYEVAAIIWLGVWTLIALVLFTALGYFLSSLKDGCVLFIRVLNDLIAQVFNLFKNPSLSNTSIYLERSFFRLERHMFGFCYFRKLEQTSDRERKNFWDLDQVVYVKVGEKYYEVAGMTQAECNWLVKEIEDWLR
ncbi:MAG: serine/threonine protein kinase [Oscillatoria princeps RMCB-10]|jgi:serine/threonine protein kinase|nr:serine/threonine protein kinase [Oscillatoria princeps RMCB-10]